MRDSGVTLIDVRRILWCGLHLLSNELTLQLDTCCCCILRGIVFFGNCRRKKYILMRDNITISDTKGHRSRTLQMSGKIVSAN